MFCNTEKHRPNNCSSKKVRERELSSPEFLQKWLLPNTLYCSDANFSQELNIFSLLFYVKNALLLSAPGLALPYTT